jgi:hypothetical protein
MEAAATSAPTRQPAGRPRTLAPAPAGGEAARAALETTTLEIHLSWTWPCAVEKERREKREEREKRDREERSEK